MFKQLNNLAGDENYLITSLILFMVFFAIMTIYILKMSKEHVNKMKNMPINDDKQTQDYEKE